MQGLQTAASSVPLQPTVGHQLDALVESSAKLRARISTLQEILAHPAPTNIGGTTGKPTEIKPTNQHIILGKITDELDACHELLSSIERAL